MKNTMIRFSKYFIAVTLFMLLPPNVFSQKNVVLKPVNYKRYNSLPVFRIPVKNGSSSPNWYLIPSPTTNSSKIIYFDIFKSDDNTSIKKLKITGSLHSNLIKGINFIYTRDTTVHGKDIQYYNGDHSLPIQSQHRSTCFRIKLKDKGSFKFHLKTKDGKDKGAILYDPGKLTATFKNAKEPVPSPDTVSIKINKKDAIINNNKKDTIINIGTVEVRSLYSFLTDTLHYKFKNRNYQKETKNLFKFIVERGKDTIRFHKYFGNKSPVKSRDSISFKISLSIDLAELRKSKHDTSFSRKLTLHLSDNLYFKKDYTFKKIVKISVITPKHHTFLSTLYIVILCLLFVVLIFAIYICIHFRVKIKKCFGKIFCKFRKVSQPTGEVQQNSNTNEKADDTVLLGEIAGALGIVGNNIQLDFANYKGVIEKLKNDYKEVGKQNKEVGKQNKELEDKLKAKDIEIEELIKESKKKKEKCEADKTALEKEKTSLESKLRTPGYITSLEDVFSEIRDIYEEIENKITNRKSTIYIKLIKPVVESLLGQEEENIMNKIQEKNLCKTLGVESLNDLLPKEDNNGKMTLFKYLFPNFMHSFINILAVSYIYIKHDNFTGIQKILQDNNVNPDLLKKAFYLAEFGMKKAFDFDFILPELEKETENGFKKVSDTKRLLTLNEKVVKPKTDALTKEKKSNIIVDVLFVGYNCKLFTQKEEKPSVVVLQ